MGRDKQGGKDKGTGIIDVDNADNPGTGRQSDRDGANDLGISRQQEDDRRAKDPGIGPPDPGTRTLDANGNRRVNYPGIDKQPERDGGGENLGIGVLGVDGADNPNTCTANADRNEGADNSGICTPDADRDGAVDNPGTCR